ncbi:hypothetical protein [Streptomyces sp. NPDC127072]|uniref:hypothetical protein n=1 Tax=Streptomyces sp. NPDC127072 TaxID=3347129 RepID=UPI003668A822
MSNETRDEVAEVFKKHGKPAIFHRDDDGTVHVEEVDILDVLRRDLGEDARLLDDHLATLSEEEIEQFRKDAHDTNAERAFAALTMRARRKRLREYLREQPDA